MCSAIRLHAYQSFFYLKKRFSQLYSCSIFKLTWVTISADREWYLMHVRILLSLENCVCKTRIIRPCCACGRTGYFPLICNCRSTLLHKLYICPIMRRTTKNDLYQMAQILSKLILLNEVLLWKCNLDFEGLIYSEKQTSLSHVYCLPMLKWRKAWTCTLTSEQNQPAFSHLRYWLNIWGCSTPLFGRTTQND